MERFNLKITPLLMIIFGVVLRLLPHPPNFAPIAALALFSGVYLPKKYAFILPLGAVFFSDLFLGFYGQEMFWVYGSFLIVGLIGLWVRQRKNVLTILGGSLASSVLFFFITNFGVWTLLYSWYPKNSDGLIQSYIAGLPFFRNTLVGDLFYTAVFFGGYELAHFFAKKYLPAKIFKIAF